MKINLFAKYLLAATLFTGVAACQNPLKDFNLQISTEIIKHKAVMKIVDLNGNVIPGAAVKLVSGDIQDIYNMEGTKDFKVNEGIVVFGLNPNVTVTDHTIIRFRVEVTAPDYITQIIPVTITNGSQGITTVVMIKPDPIPEGGGLQQELTNVDLALDGSTTQETAVTVPAATPGAAQLSISIPSGTQFKDASGQVVVGGAVTVNVGSLDPENENIDATLPGGSLAVDAVVKGDGTEGGGTFSPAGITRITMLVNGVSIKEFSQPIAVRIPLPSSYVSPITGLPIAAGQPFEIYSNSSTDNKWKYERTVTVSGSASTGYYAEFTINHLSYYMAAEFKESCSTGTRINFTGSWMDNNSTTPLTVEIEWKGRRIYSREHSISSAMKSVVIDNMPNESIRVIVKNKAGTVIHTSAVAACGQVTNVVLPNPNPTPSPSATLQLYVRCPNSTGVITFLPTFELFYKESGSTGEFKYLGTVVNGLLKTHLLETNGKKYDFQAHYNNKSKTVVNKTISADNSGTVGNQPGDLLINDVNNNLGIMKEECDKL